jgi:hypothetical protein
MEVVLSKRHRRPFGKVLRRLRRRLGPLRDTDVMLGHLRDLAAVHRHAVAAGWLAQHLSGQREALRRASAGQGPPAHVLARLGAWWGVREEIAESRDAVDNLLAESLHSQVGDFADQARRLVETLKRQRAATGGAPAAAPIDLNADAAAGDAIATDGPTAPAAPQQLPAPAPAPIGVVAGVRQDPHELRITGKALRYTLEMAAAAGHPVPGPLLKKFKRMQESLGMWHDFVVLTDRAMQASLAETLGHHDAPLQEHVLDLARVSLRKSALHLDHFVKLWSERGGDMAAAIRAIFPLVRGPASSVLLPPTGPDAPPVGMDRLTESKTGPGPTGSEQPASPASCPPAAASNA